VLVRNKMNTLLEHGVVPVVAGGVAGSLAGRVVMLGWAGEVLAGLVLGNLLGAREVRVLREPPGIYPVEPPPPGAEPLKTVGVNYAVALARLGLLRLTPKADRNLVMEVKLVYSGFIGEATRITPVEGSGVIGITSASIGQPAASGMEYCRVARIETLGRETLVVQELGTRPFCVSRTAAIKTAGVTLALLAGIRASFEQLGVEPMAILPFDNDTRLILVEGQNSEDIALKIYDMLRGRCK
jgi:hypothetical protein